MKFENYTVRLIEQKDLESYYRLIENNRARLEDFFTGTVSRTQTFEATKQFLNEILQKLNDKIYFPFVIIDNTTNEVIGYIDLKNIDWNLPKTELGFYMDKNYTGKGLTSKAFGLVVDHCFKTLQFKKLFLRTHQSNIAAQKLAEKCGFEIEGRIRCDYKTTKGELVDLIYYGQVNDSNE